MKTVLKFLSSWWGKAAVAVALALLIAMAYHGCRSDQANPLPPRTNSTELTRHLVNPGSIPTPRPAAKPVATPTNAPKRSLILSIDAHLPASTNLDIFAPAGTLIVCQLVNTIESIRIETPIIAVVIRDVWFDGKLIIPAGTKVLGKAQVDRVRDRIAAQGTWTLVFSSGEELVVHGQALHREELVPGERWGLEDGSPGFKGQVIKTATLDEIKLFAAAFLSGVSQGFQETESTILGSRARRSIQNAALAGSSAVLDEYAHSIAESIKRDGVYVRVTGGSEFYLYLPTTLDRSAARIGATNQKTPKP